MKYLDMYSMHHCMSGSGQVFRLDNMFGTGHVSICLAAYVQWDIFNGLKTNCIKPYC